MKVTAVKTHKITTADKDILKVIDKYVTNLSERNILVVTSKIIAICEGRTVLASSTTKDELVEQEADYYLPRSLSKYNVCISVKNSIMVASAGIDESNGNGNFVLWPKDPQASANSIRKFLQNKFKLKEVGIIISDSKTTPLRWGVTGVALAHSGFEALNSYIDKPDIFGRLMQVEKLNISDSLATAAVSVMGEGSEQTPLCVISNLPQVKFQNRSPNQAELESLKISLEDDIYAPLLTKVKWKKRL